MTNSLIIQHTYQAVEIGFCQNGVVKAQCQEDKVSASKNLILCLQKFLTSQGVTLNDLSYIGANQGPGPFTTLRVVIACVNGIAFATHIPLVGVDGLTALVHENRLPDYPVTVALLNAYHKDVYFSVDTPGLKYSGCASSAVVLEGVAKLPDLVINFVGNGAEMHKEEIVAMFGTRAFFLDPIPQGPSLKQIATMAQVNWWNKQTVNQLEPIYLKQNMATG